MSTQAIQAGEAFVNLNVRGDAVQKALNNIGDKLDDFGSKTVSSLSTIRGALGDVIGDCGQFGDVFSAAGIGLTGLSFSVGTLTKVSSSFHSASEMCQRFNFQELRRIATLKLSTVITGKSVLAQKTLALASLIAASSLKVMAFAQSVLNMTIFCCPLGWLAAGLAGIIAIGGGVMWWMGMFTDKTAESAKTMAELREQNDKYRESAKESIGTLEDLARRENLSAQQKDVSRKAYAQLQKTCGDLGIDIKKLGISFDESTGQMNASAQALSNLKEAMRMKEMDDLNKEFDAQSKYLAKLQSSIRLDGDIGKWRKFGTIATLGYMDNADEIRQKIEETKQKIQENVNKQKVVVDWSVEFRENEEKLREWQKADTEAVQNETQKKIAAIQTELAERRKVLERLVAEAQARSDLSAQEQTELAERKEALAGLNAEQARRIQLLKDEETAKIQKIQDDFTQKRVENKENEQWKGSLETNPNEAFATATAQSSAADKAFQDAIEARKNAFEATSDELAKLDKKIVDTQKEAEKWYSRQEEATKKVAEAKAKAEEEARKVAEEAAEEARKATEDAAKLQEDREAQIDELQTGKQAERDKREEEASWKNSVKNDSGAAKTLAQENLKAKQGQINSAYADLRRLASSGASDAEYQAQLAKVQQMENDIDLWQQRLDDLNIDQMEDAMPQTQELVDGPQTLLAGSMDAQKKFFELQQKSKNPLEEKADETNRLLKRVADSSENMENQMVGV